MYSCKEASRIASEAMDRKLTLGERINLRMHLFVCDMCRSFEQNIHLLEQTMRKIGSDDTVPETLSEQDRQVIRARFGERLK